jgi:hypothetical protein
MRNQKETKSQADQNKGNSEFASFICRGSGKPVDDFCKAEIEGLMKGILLAGGIGYAVVSGDAGGFKAAFAGV